LADRTPNLRSGPGSNPVLAVREPDRGQSNVSHSSWNKISRVHRTVHIHRNASSPQSVKGTIAIITAIAAVTAIIVEVSKFTRYLHIRTDSFVTFTLQIIVRIFYCLTHILCFGRRSAHQSWASTRNGRRPISEAMGRKPVLKDREWKL